MAEIDQLSIGIEAEAPKAAKTIDSLVGKLDILVKHLSAVTTTPVKINIDTSKFDKIGKSLKLDGLDKTAKVIGETTAQITDKIEEFRKKYEDIGKSFEASDSLKKAQSQLLQFSDLFQKAKLDKESFEASGNLGTKGYERAAENFYKYSNVIENIKQKITELNHTPIKFDFSQISQMSEAELDKALGFPNISTWADKISQSAKEVAEESRESAREFTGAWNGIELPNFDSDIKNLGDKLRQLEIPPIREENLDKLRSSLEKTESKLEELRANLENGLTMGRITESVDDKGYVKLQEQIALTEKTAAALRDRIKEVGKESKNTSGIKEVGKAAKSASDSFSDLAKSGAKASNSLKKVESGLKSVLRALLPILGIRELINLSKKSVESIGDYMESFNFYDVAFNKVASEWSGDFEKYGYQNASSYAESFTDRMDSTFKKLSGVSFEINAEGKGLLSETGLKNLGLNIQEITQYASQLASVTNSLGLVGEASLATSSAFTKLAGDISSLFNVDYKTAADNLQSGLIGQSRALYKYGIDITNATLQTKAYEIGLTKAVSEMTQSEKMQLRVLSILEQSKVAWGDQARTLNQFANQMRFLKNGVQELSTMFGQLFIPTLTKILPVINGVVIAIKRLVGYIASLAGIELDLSGSGMSGMEEDLGDISDGFDSVTASAKKAKAGLRAFDELKVINMPDTSGVAAGGAGAGIDLTDEILKATEEYEKVWSEAFKNMENKAQEWADKIEKALEPIKKIFQDFAIGDFFQAGKDVSALVVSITDFFADAIDKVDWYGIGKKIGDFLAGIDWLAILKSVGNLIWQAIKASIELWVGSFTAAPIETGLITALALMKFTRLGNIVRPKIVSAIINTKLITSLAESWTSLGGLGGILTTDLETIMGAGTVAEIGTTIGVGIIGGLAAAFAGFNIGKEIGKWIFPEDAEWYDNFHWFGEGGFFDMSIEDAWGGMIEWAKDTNSQLGILIKIKERLEESGFKLSGWIEFSTGVIGTLDKIKGWDGFSEWFEISVGPWFAKERWNALGENIKTGLQSKSKDFFTWWKDKGAPDWFTVSVSPIFSYGRWSELGENIKSALSGKWKNFTSWWNEGGAEKWFETSVSPIFSINKWNFSGIADGLSQAWENAVAAIKDIWNKFVEWINEKLDFSWNPISILGKEIVPGGNMKLGKIGKFPSYATGGFPEDGWFRASHGEIMGQFDNGQSVVANNYQITEGISEAVYNAVSAAIKNNTSANEVPEVRVYIGNKEITDIAIEGIRDRVERTKKMPFPIYAK